MISSNLKAGNYNLEITKYIKAYFKMAVVEKNRFLGLSKSQECIVSGSEIDGERLSDDLQKAITIINQSGYSVVSITPITSGNDVHDYQNGIGYGWGAGYSYTEGLVVMARKNDLG